MASCSAAPGPVSLGALGVKHGVTEGKKCDYEGPEKANEERFLEKDHEQVFALAGVCAAHDEDGDAVQQSSLRRRHVKHLCFSVRQSVRKRL